MERTALDVLPMSKKSDYLKLCDEIWEHNWRYYVVNAPTISDYAFDALLKQCEALEKSHPEWIFPGSPTQRVGEMVSGSFSTASHTVPMLSLGNAYSQEEIEDFLVRIEKGVSSDKLAFEVEPKFDGIAISLRYEKGVFTRALTRGNGEEGEVVTANIRTIASLPLKLRGKVPDVLEVRGEVFISKKVFSHLNQQQEEMGKAPFANPRNAAGGSLKLLDPKEVSRRRLSVTCYHAAEGLVAGSQFEVLKQLKAFGLPVVGESAYCESKAQIWKFIEDLGAKRASLPYEIDGVVIKVDNQKWQERLGNTGKHVKWAIAYKYAPEQSETVIKEITVQVGRTGVLTPVAELTPVLLAGSTISRATLHNEEEVQRKDIRKNDVVLIEKGGDVIPKIVSVVTSKRPKESHAWHMPPACPVCGTKVIRVKGEVAVRCPNKRTCPAQSVKRLIHFVSKGGMDIDHLGEKIVQLLVDHGFVTTYSDFFRLTKEQLAQLPGFKEKAIENLLKSIEAAKKVPLHRLIMALGISLVGAETAELLAEEAKTLDHLIKMEDEAFLKLEGVGPKVAASLVTYFADPVHLQEIEELLELGIKPKTSATVTHKEHGFSGKTFVLTGTLLRYSRTQAANEIKARGGKVSNSVSKATSYLLLGEDPGSKYEKAKKLNVPILSEDDFEKLL